jgi:predicted DNA-binding transcriptional regulator AlpA
MRHRGLQGFCGIMGLGERHMKLTIEGLLKEDEAAKVLGYERKSLESMRYQRRGPNFVRMGHAVRYRLADLQDYIEKHLVRVA